MSRVISAFPATGKSYVAQMWPSVADSDSSTFSRGNEWPQNYILHILTRSNALVLVSTHAEVRAALVDASIPFTLVYPARTLREEYRERMERRGSSEPLIRKVIDELWDAMLDDCEAQRGCDHVVLGPGRFLADVLPVSVPSTVEQRP